ncbi:uncharacterized protein [Onthophagus taurus]|uniref:uncharacterized protein n=1 Tax=Onthophagus taurus TaxID=166361 RepID=UPI0039BE44F0
MKIEIFLLLFYLVSIKKADPIKAPLHIISYDDISPAEREHLAFLEEMNKQREKRSGHSLLSILGNGLKNKLGSLAKASASSSAHFISSSSSSGHDYHHDHHHDEHDYEQKTFDFWTLNKSILNTLLQAVKAIKGATIALTGKLIKGSGYLVSAKGKLISHGGDAVTSLGKKIATSALLSPVAHGSHSSSYSDHPHEEYNSEYGPSSHQDSDVSPSAIAADYNPPPDLSNKYLPSKYSNYEDKNSFLNQLPEGIIILKKMPSSSGFDHNLEGQESQNIPDFKPLDPQTPNYREVLANLLASSSGTNLKPNSSPSFENFEKNRGVNNIAQLPLEHKSPSVNYLKYFKDTGLMKRPSTFSIHPMNIYNPQTEFLNFHPPNFNAPPPLSNHFQSFSNQPFLNQFNSMPMMGYEDLTPQYSNQHQNQLPNQNFQPDTDSLEMLQPHDPRSFSKPLLPTPLTSSEFIMESPGKVKKTPLKSKKPNIDVVKSITYELRPNGPVKI